MKLIATCAFGIEKIVKNELLFLGFNDIKGQDGKIEFGAEMKDICRCNLNLRTANRVLLKIGEFRAVTFDELFEKTKRLPWEKFIPEDGEFPVSKISSIKSALFAKSSAQAIVKKAVVEKLKETYKIERFTETGSLYSIHVHIMNDVVTISLDTTGHSLNRRGYREKGNSAPLKETLAAALIRLARWSPKRETIYDPFCGTGTILIEAAMIANNIATGEKQKFVSENWDFIPQENWEEARKEALDAHSIVENLNILGSDIDESVIKTAKENSKKAGVDKYIKFLNKDLIDIEAPAETGVIICNPPYGERMLEEEDAYNLYMEMGNVFREKFPKWDYFILTSHPKFEQAFGQRSDRNRKLYNGKIMCYLYQYFNYKNND